MAFQKMPTRVFSSQLPKDPPPWLTSSTINSEVFACNPHGPLSHLNKHAASLFTEEKPPEPMLWILDSAYHYGTEFYGTDCGVALTPITERCFLTMSMALNQCLGARIAGPVGVGKTETIRVSVECEQLRLRQKGCSGIVCFAGITCLKPGRFPLVLGEKVVTSTTVSPPCTCTCCHARRCSVTFCHACRCSVTCCHA